LTLRPTRAAESVITRECGGPRGADRGGAAIEASKLGA
jgi:hypothetical protein